MVEGRNVHKWLIRLLVTLLLAVAPPSEAQQPGKMPRVGYLSGSGTVADRGPYFDALRQGLQSWGYYEGKNITY
jgi:hypothetical protein